MTDTVTDTLAGDWTGSISIAGVELNIDLHLTRDGDAYSATLDIPQQSAMGLPVGNLVVEPPAVRFTILEGAQQASFEGALDEDGAISGVFSQAGQEGAFAMVRADSAAVAAPAVVPGPATTGISEIYTDTSGLWSVPVPTGWTVTPAEGFVTLQAPDGEVTVHIFTVPNEDQQAAIADSWQAAQPGFDMPIDETVTPPAPEGIEKVVVNSYETGDDNRIVQAAAQLYDGVNYVQLFELSLDAAQRRTSQITIIDSGFKILADQKTDLTGKQPAELTPEIINTWEAVHHRHAGQVQCSWRRGGRCARW